MSAHEGAGPTHGVMSNLGPTMGCHEDPISVLRR